MRRLTRRLKKDQEKDVLVAAPLRTVLEGFRARAQGKRKRNGKGYGLYVASCCVPLPILLTPHRSLFIRGSYPALKDRGKC